jgi:hypothetical protein
MKSAFARHATLVLCLLAPLSAVSCGSGGRKFLEERSSIDISDGPLCGAGVEEHKSCRPEDFGEGHWTRETRFPSFTTSEFAGRQGIQDMSAEIRAYYLGALYYDNEVHTYCKRAHGQNSPAIARSDPRDFEEGMNLQVYDVREMIEKRVIRPLTSRLHSELSYRSQADASGIATRFYENLMEETRERVDARVLWFVIRYPGGVEDMAHDQELRRCVMEAGHRDGWLITGVAGYAMLKNDIDESISSREVVHRALERANAEYQYTLDMGLESSLASEWQEKLDRIAHVKLTRKDITATAWPLWVRYD